MLTPAFKRLVWKDAHALAAVGVALWLALACLQVVGIVFERSWIAAGHWEWMWFAIGPLAYCFAVAAAGILFAGEAEEGTDDWLRTLPIRRRTLVGAKLGTGVAGTLAFVAAGAVTGGVIAAGSGLTSVPLTGAVRATGEAALLAALGLVSGLFFSVRLRRVTTSFAVAALAGLVIAVVGINLFDGRHSPRRETLGLAVIVGAIAVLDVWLVGRWAEGRSVALWRPRASDWTSGRWTERLSRGRLGLLTSAAASGSPAARRAGVLAWKESRGTTLFVAVWGTFAIGIVLLGWQQRFSSVPVVLATPLIAGLLTMLGDQHRRSQLFLGDRGVSPATSWLTRHAVWMTSTALLLAGLIWLDSALQWDGRGDGHLKIRSAAASVRHMVDQLPWNANVYSGPEEYAQGAWWGLSLLLTLYVVGHVCAMVFRRPVLAGGVSLLLGFLTFGWHALVLHADVPLAWTTAPLVLLWLAGTWRLTEGWQTGDESWSYRRRQAAWLAGPVLVALCGLSYARRTQVPDVDVAPLQRLIVLDDSRRAEMTRELGDEWLAVTGQAESFVVNATGAAPWDRKLGHDPASVSTGSEQQTQGLEERFHDLANRLRSYGGRRLAAQGAPNPEVCLSISHFADLHGRQLEQAGRVSEAFDLYVDGLCLLRTFPWESPHEFRLVVQQRSRLFSLIADWANSPDRTLEQLRAAWDVAPHEGIRLETSFGSWNDAPRLATTHARRMEEFFNHRGPYYNERWQQRLDEAGGGYALYRAGLLAFGEPERLRRMFNIYIREADAISHSTMPISTNGFPYVYPNRTLRSGGPGESITVADESLLHSVASRAEIERWTESAWPWIHPELHPEAFLASLAEVEYWSRREVAAERAVRVILALQIYRHERGEFPRQLSELVGPVLEGVPVDPFTGGDFLYVPDGLPAAAEVRMSGTAPVVIPARQPLLYSPGPSGRTFEYLPFAGTVLERLPAEAPRGMYLESPLYGPDASESSRIGIPPGRDEATWLADVSRPTSAPSAVSFAVLGTNWWLPWGVPNPSNAQ